MFLAITAPGHMRATDRAPTPHGMQFPVFAVFGEGHRVGGPGPLSVCCCCSLSLRPPGPQSDPRDRVALPCQPSQMKLAPTSSMATSRWTAPRTSTSQAPWSSTGGPWTSTRPVSSTSWRRGPPTRASTSWCVRPGQRPHAVAPRPARGSVPTQLGVGCILSLTSSPTALLSRTFIHSGFDDFALSPIYSLIHLPSHSLT